MSVLTTTARFAVRASRPVARVPTTSRGVHTLPKLDYPYNMCPVARRLGRAKRPSYLECAMDGDLSRHSGRLYDFHVSNDAKMVPFAGYSMPLSYGNGGAVASHHHVRNSVGLFDVGHMVQSNGIIDDTVITKHADDAFYVVTNAGRRDRDLAWFKERLEEWNTSEKAKAEGKVEHEVLEDWGLLALQGMRSAFVPIEGFNLHVARGGYTGEDGFEDLDEDTTPVEAGLTWVIGKERRENGQFIGADGSVTYGIPSPSLGKNIAMGYVNSGWHKKGDLDEIVIRVIDSGHCFSYWPYLSPLASFI
ncbi:Aminomethyltransferase folate-binding domain-containing protein [Dichomitus squalens LYAD-421 SS1]|uniref:Aminomethyltransferase folate-binding domain-containing protein n=1 Tax=Dichomitus squalens (strain LYAD-421) TaxID=732165 RepID=R7SPD0_DICSQ|nr:Aminomethyltransferase folate-binding domain-containing protein [Dichomitus squalens LYAD-421 SS1]EJF58044.1 Aminomethyltransferase folate-binding domain-containing protein [Dichomitus squalens LYAD-421 SS1]